jgi:hypothetical protein
MKPLAAVELELLEGNFTIHRLSPSAEIPVEVFSSVFLNISKTEEELSIVCPSSLELKSEHRDNDWVCIKVRGSLDFGLTGVLAKLCGVLAEAQLSIFAISTYDTDYILVKATKANKAVSALETAGYKFT